MKKINNMTVFEPTDKCSLDEYSQKAAIEVPELIKKAKEEVNQKVIEISENDIKQDNEILELKTNYTNLQEQNTKLEEKIKKDRDNMINLEVEGQSIHIEDSSDLEGKLEVLGNVEQDTREGYNLCPDDINNWESGQYGGDGNKAPDNNAIRLKELLKIDSNSSYFLRTFSTDYNFIIRVYNANKVFTRSLGSQADSSIIKINDNEEYLGVSLWSPKGKPSTYDNYVELFKNNTIKPFITTESNKEKPYEQYGVSPSPEYPSEIRAVGDNINLWDKENMLVELGGYSGSNGNKYDSTTRIRNTKDIELKKDTYTLSAENSKLISIYIVDLKKELSSNGDSVTFTLEKDNTIRFTIENTALLNTETKLERGNKKTGYSPYGQGSVEIKKQTQNILSLTELPATIDGITVNKNSGKIVLNGTTTKQNDKYKIGTFNTRENRNYILSITNKVNGLGFNANFNTIGLTADFNITKTGPKLTGKSMTTNAGKVELYMAFNKDITFNNLEIGIMVEEDKETGEFVEHQEQTKILPTQKPMLEGDYFDKLNNKEVHTWKKIVLDGVNNKVTQETTATNGKYRYKYTDKDFKNCSLSEEKAYCTHLQLIEKNKTYDKIVGFTVSNGALLIYTDGDTAVNFNTKLQKENYIFYIPVIESAYQKIDLTPKQIEVLDQLDNLETYKPVTNITTDSIAKLKLKYIADTKTYVDNKTSNLEQQVSVINQLLSTTKTSSILLDNLQKDIESEVL